MLGTALWCDATQFQPLVQLVAPVVARWAAEMLSPALVSLVLA
jgi:hypothetical protein